MSALAWIAMVPTVSILAGVLVSELYRYFWPGDDNEYLH